MTLRALDDDRQRLKLRGRPLHPERRRSRSSGSGIHHPGSQRSLRGGRGRSRRIKDPPMIEVDACGGSIVVHFICMEQRHMRYAA